MKEGRCVFNKNNVHKERQKYKEGIYAHMNFDFDGIWTHNNRVSMQAGAVWSAKAKVKFI